jgi:hypothetical protein
MEGADWGCLALAWGEFWYKMRGRSLRSRKAEQAGGMIEKEFMSYDLGHRTTVSCMVATVTLNISDEVYQRLELNARATQRSIEDILAYVFKVGSPPEWQDVPEEYRDALRGLDALSDEALRQLAMGQMAESDLERYDELLELNATGGVSSAEREELQRLRWQSECFMLRKAQAAVLLRWRGFQVVAG